MEDRIELLCESLIDEYPDLAMDVLGYSAKFGKGLGWHYVLDLIWILKEIDCPPGSLILDAGAGVGLLQYMLALKGYSVVGVDRYGVKEPACLKNCCQMRFLGQEKEPLAVFDATVFKKKKGDLPEIWFYESNLAALSAISADTFDAVVSVSALEHNPPEKIPGILTELSRVLKKDAHMFLTISAAPENTRHEASNSWLMNESEIASRYGLQNGYATNFSAYDEIFQKICRSERLQRWLASFYFQGEKNGMPYGVWNPQYQPVAIRKKNRK
jgi:hypothetical protein